MADASNALVPMSVATMTDADIDRMYRISKALALSKRFPDAKTAEEAFAKVLLGRDLGLSPTQALTGIYIVEGKPQIAGVTLAAFVRKSPDYDYEILHLDGNNEDPKQQGCSLRFFALGPNGQRRPLVPDITYTLEDAQKLKSFKIAGGPWTTARRNMFFWRSMSDGVKIHCPDLMGGVPIYTEGDYFEGTATEVAIGTGTGDGTAPGWGDTDPEAADTVEAIVKHAQTVGHAGLSDLASIQMSLSGQSDEVIRQWCGRAWLELGEYEQRKAQQGSVEEDEFDAVAENVPDAKPEDEEALRDRLNELLDAIIAREAEEEPDEAALKPLREEADDIRRRLEPSGEQTGMDL